MNDKSFLFEFIKTIEETLAFEYVTPDHNNKKDPLEEMIFILLSIRTGIIGYEKVFDNLKKKFNSWDDVLNSSDVDLYNIVSHAGLGSKRVRDLKSNLALIKEKFGRISLNPLRRKNESEAFLFLTSLEGIGPQSAFCIMMYSLNRQVFSIDTHVLRICRRLGYMEENIDRKLTQFEMADIFPKQLRYSLHVNMLAHGRKICKPRNPKCTSCIISKFCKYNRKHHKLTTGPGYLDLFSGVKKKGFGNLGRNGLYKEVLRFVNDINPKYVVIENVPGMKSHINIEYVDRIENGLRFHGYEVKHELLNSRKFEILQNRTRLFFIARKIYRQKKYRAREELDMIWKRIHQSVSIRDISFIDGISGLPALKAGDGADILNKVGNQVVSEYAQAMSNDNNMIFNHKARKHNSRDLKAYKMMKEGENAQNLYARSPDLMIYSSTNFHTKYYKLKSCTPSPTIVAHLRKDANSLIQPFDNRGITPREAARLKSFPDDYRFLGTFGKQFEQIGNAVPPKLAEVIAESIMKVIMKNNKEE